MDDTATFRYLITVSPILFEEEKHLKMRQEKEVENDSGEEEEEQGNDSESDNEEFDVSPFKILDLTESIKTR